MQVKKKKLNLIATNDKLMIIDLIIYRYLYNRGIELFVG